MLFYSRIEMYIFFILEYINYFFINIIYIDLNNFFEKVIKIYMLILNKLIFYIISTNISCVNKILVTL